MCDQLTFLHTLIGAFPSHSNQIKSIKSSQTLSFLLDPATVESFVALEDTHLEALEILQSLSSL